ncbi:L-lactate dehydrogenase complex protein LldE [Chitinophaga jiangningensis]|uniref:L-lactate dehydrogenase complex protein LldE n=1 Tax=Chitinophaga jiangningensis TaxID=1419482 RepID=A0A1M7M3Y3_9BACT|nr:(Fe-S)-binding protein [Chitinophaga jiangningensis]SHM84914.1 L-lactate dehydrogenase complex protein LldE [Chitinophaga jiangningensis]
MKVGLFIPCYIDQFYPQVGIATLQLLQKLGCQVVYPQGQTCCGQPMANSGFEHLTHGCNSLFVDHFDGFDYVVAPSGSCVLHIKEHLHEPAREAAATNIRQRVYELTEFLTDILKVASLPARFPHKVGLHQSCHGQRGLHLAQMSELVDQPYSKPGHLLNMVDGLELVDLDRKDECCGFGGTFCVAEEAVSVKMGVDRVADHVKHDAEVITGTDVSCLMHLEGIINRRKQPLRVMHIAEILNNTI